MYQPDFPPVPFRLGLYPVVDSVQWIERLLDAGVRTLQLRIKDRRDEEVEADVVAAIALGRRYNARLFINDYWRLAIKHQAYGVHLGQEDLQATDLNAIRAAACGWAFRHMTIWKSTSRWQHAPLISRWDMCSRRKPNRCLLHRRGWNSWHGMLSDWRIIHRGDWRYQSGTRACGDSNGCRQYRRRQRHYSSCRLAFGNGTVAGNCRSWR